MQIKDKTSEVKKTWQSEDHLVMAWSASGEGRIVIGHKENGDPIFRYLYAETQKELTAKLRQNITAYQGVDLTEECRMTLSEWLDRWLEEYMAGRIRSTTMDVYRRDLDNHVKPYIGEKPLLKLSAEDLRSLYQTLMERGNRNKGSEHGTGLSPTTVRVGRQDI